MLSFTTFMMFSLVENTFAQNLFASESMQGLRGGFRVLDYRYTTKAARSSCSIISVVLSALLHCRRVFALNLYNCARDAHTVALFCATAKETAWDKHVSSDRIHNRKRRLHLSLEEALRERARLLRNQCLPRSRKRYMPLLLLK